MKIPNKKIIVLVVFAVILAIGIFLRAYNFSDWLHFELDQSRDAKLIDLAIQNGPENLPLLGPKAAGSFLRLGPIFYYFNYISALVFGNTPEGMAGIIMIFGILAIPAFYFLARRYFSVWIALALALIFSTSLFLAMYSRFSWNPNALPFFTIMLAYSLLRAADKDEKNSGHWLMGAAFFLAVATQLHFLAFVSMPVIALVFLLIKRPKVKWQYWLGAAAIILVMNLPIIINEIKTGGANSRQFMEVATGKSEKSADKTLIEKVFKNYTENSSAYFLILASKNTDLPTLEKNPESDIRCEKLCREGKFPGLAAILIFSLGIFFALKNFIFEKNAGKKDFLMMVIIWFVVSFGLFTPLAFNISPRFWLIISALPFIFLGLSFEFFGKILPKKIWIILIAAVTIAFFWSNLSETYGRFQSLEKASTEVVDSLSDRILKERYRVTLEQQYAVVDYLESFYKKNGYTVYLNSSNFYSRSLRFHLDRRGIPRDGFGIAASSSQIYKNGNYFLVYPTSSNLQRQLDKYVPIYEEINRQQFGTLIVIQLVPKESYITDIQQAMEVKKVSKNAPGVPKRYIWGEIFGNDNNEIDVDEISADEIEEDL